MATIQFEVLRSMILSIYQLLERLNIYHYRKCSKMGRDPGKLYG